MSTPRRRFIPNFDRLEDRTVPAGNVMVTVANGSLSLIGDQDANSLTVVRHGTTGIRITSGSDATTINGEAGPVDFDNVTQSINIWMKDGDDHLEMSGIEVAGSVNIALGAGDDYLKLTGIGTHKNSIVYGEDGNDVIEVADSFYVKKFEVYAGAGDDQINLANSHFGRRSRIDGGSGTDSSDSEGNSFGAKSSAVSLETINTTIAPVAHDDQATLAEGGNTAIHVGDNDTTLTGTLDPTSLVITQQPAHGTVTANNDGTITYTHDGSNTTSDTFKYTIENSAGHTSNAATVSLTITATNDAPVAVNDASTVAEAGNVTIPVTTNDTDSDGTIDQTSIIITQQPTQGTVTVNANGSVLYTHDGSETTTDTFKYTVNDNLGAVSNIATVTLTITAANDAPVAVNDTATLAEGGTAIIDLAANDTDADGTIAVGTIVITVQPTHGSIVVNGDGTVTYTHDGSETTSDSFKYTIKDNTGATSNAGTATITITPVNDAPHAVDDEVTLDEGASTSINLAANDTDADGTLQLDSIEITQAPAHGTLVDNHDGTFTYTHDGSETTTDTFKYTIKDNNGLPSNAAEVKLHITPVNDAPLAVADIIAVAQGSSVIIPVISNDSDVDGTLDLSSIVTSDGPSHGNLVDNHDGTLTYTHDGTANASDSFAYTIKDNLGAPSNKVTVSITIALGT